MLLLSLSDFEIVKKIGQGTYGTVYKARDLRPAAKVRRVALKRIDLDSDEGISASTLREVALLKRLRHPSVVTLHGLFFESSCMYLVFECFSGDLKQFMSKQRGSHVSLRTATNIMRQVVEGVSFCHSRGVLHRDLKPHNILIDFESHRVKVTDFGLARAVILPGCDWTHEVVTLWYRAPEVLLGCDAYSLSIDSWAMGCILAEMLNDDQVLLSGNSELALLLSIFRSLGTPSAHTWPALDAECKDFNGKFPKWTRCPMRELLSHRRGAQDLDTRQGRDLIDCLDALFVLDPKQRLSAKEALAHPCFAKERKEEPQSAQTPNSFATRKQKEIKRKSRRMNKNGGEKARRARCTRKSVSVGREFRG